MKERNAVAELSVDVTLTCTQLSDEDLSETGVVVVDILRATTTVTQALAAGALEVLPVAHTDEAIALGRERGARVGGEREGLRLEGFDLGNSPLEYVPGTVGGQAVVLTTSNGTRAMQLCRGARWTVVGSFNNLDAVVRYVCRHRPAELIVACAGTERGRAVAPEDVLFAGALLQRLQGCDDVLLRPGGGALVALGYAGACEDPLSESLLSTPHGSRLVELGMSTDVRWAAQVSVIDSVGLLREDESGLLHIVEADEETEM